jgi:hypothetical protein
MPSSDRPRVSVREQLRCFVVLLASDTWVVAVIGAGLLALAGVGWLLVRLVTPDQEPATQAQREWHV